MKNRFKRDSFPNLGKFDPGLYGHGRAIQERNVESWLTESATVSRLEALSTVTPAASIRFAEQGTKSY